jgi:replicative DNA helicase
MNDNTIANQTIEKHCIAGFLKNPKKILELIHVVDQTDFVHNPHASIFSILKDSALNNKATDPVIIAERLAGLGITYKGNLDILDYLQSLSYIKITEKALEDACKILKTLSVRRDVYNMAGKMRDAMLRSSDDEADKIISMVDKMYADRISAYNLSDKPEDLFDGIVEMIEHRALNPINETGLLTPYKKFNEMYGGLRDGEIYAWVSRPKHGKALGENTLIPTPTGFTKICDLKIGDEVFAIDGSVTKVVATAKWQNRNTFKIKTDDCNEIIADEEHEWLARYRSNTEMGVYTTKFLYEVKKNKKVALPICSPIQMPDADLPIDPYTFGLLLCNNIADSKKYDHIPQQYLRASVTQRIELLKGLMGNSEQVAKDGIIEFKNSNKKITEGILELIYSLGMKASLTERVEDSLEETGFVKYVISFQLTDVFRLKRKSELQKVAIKKNCRYVTIEPNGVENTVCIQIDHPSHMFLCGLAMIPTHNSSILNDLAFKSTVINPNCKALILDTEMQTKDMRYRIASSITGIPMWYLETGNWARNKELVAKFNSKKTELSAAIGNVQHMTVARKNVEEITSLIQRWYLGEVGRGNPAIVVYDYIKLTGESDSNKQEYQLIGEKVDRLKECILRVNIPLLTACQLNRSAEGGNDDSSAIAQSDRLQWFASQVGIFRRKTIEEIAEDGAEFGTHKYIELACRYQGKEAHGHSNLVKVTDEKGKVKYVNNFINYRVDNFNVEELGGLDDIKKSKDVQVNVFAKENEADGLL